MKQLLSYKSLTVVDSVSVVMVVALLLTRKTVPATQPQSLQIRLNSSERWLAPLVFPETHRFERARPPLRWWAGNPRLSKLQLVM